jgi:preprotein translocase subunit SecF
MDIIGKKYIYFALSLLVIIPGLISLMLFHLKLSIDFTGGSLVEIRLEKQASTQEVRDIVLKQHVEPGSIQQSGDKTYLIRMPTIDKDQNEKVKKAFADAFGKVDELRFETVGPTIGKEISINALKALILASILIVIYIAWSFRKVPKPASSWRFGICAIVALLHDVLVVVGVFSLLGHFLNVEVDSLFVTALLTVIGFSVHDTIVVFDRIRENLLRERGGSFAQVVNESIIQTINRSLNTSITVIFVLTALLLFGGTTIRWFVVALLIGIVSGTYSSIFNASPLLVLWHEWRQKKY